MESKAERLADPLQYSLMSHGEKVKWIEDAKNVEPEAKKLLTRQRLHKRPKSSRFSSLTGQHRRINVSPTKFRRYHSLTPTNWSESIKGVSRKSLQNLGRLSRKKFALHDRAASLPVLPLSSSGLAIAAVAPTAPVIPDPLKVGCFGVNCFL